MDSTRRKGIGSFADRLRSNLGLSIPVSPEDAVAKLQGRIQDVDPRQLLGGEAKIVKTEEASGVKFEIWVDRTKSLNRRRFSIAHEIGHLFLHMGYLIDPAKWDAIRVRDESAYFRGGTSEQEFEAHEFAAAFLMPEGEFKQCAETADDLTEVAQKFEVSIDAAINRGRWLNIYSWT